MPLTIYTAGAKGVDTHVEHLCRKYQHRCVVVIPPGHLGCRYENRDGRRLSIGSPCF